MPTSSQRISPVRRVEDVAPTPLSLDPVSCQSMVSRLYTPDLVRQRRMISAAQDAEERRVKGEYDATRDMHLANYWHRQQEVKRTLRCFAKNAGPHRAATPGTIHHTTVHEVSSDMSSANRSAILPPLSSKQTSAAGSPTLRHSDGAPVAKTPVVQPPSPASSRASSRSSSRSSDTYHSPEASIVAASQQGSLAPSPSKRSQRSAEYSSDYDDDFSPTTSEAPTSPPKKQEEPTGSEKPAEARPQPSPDAQRPQRTESALAVTQTTDAANESHQVDPLSREDLATLVMIVRPSSNFAASVRRLGIHDGFDLGWIDGPKLTRPKLVTLLDIPMNPASSAEEPTNNNTTTNTSTGGAAGDPQLDGERPRTQRRSGASAATPANPDITSPRSILLMLRNSVAPADLWPVSYNDHAQAELKRGSSRTVIRHRYELREATRRATLETLRRQYAELSSQAELESIVMQLRRGAKRRSERENSLQVSRLMNDPDDDVSGTGASSHGNKTSNSSGVSSYTAKHEKRRLRLEKQFSTAMDIERMRTGKMVQRHEKELRCDETLRQKREREARERAEKGRQRDEHVQTTVDAATQLLQTKVTKLQMEQEYLEKRSDQAKERAHVENLAKMEYQLALREERLRLVAAHERRQEYEKLQLLQAAQHRQDCINDMIMKREMERRRVLEERKQQELRLEAAANKLQSDLLALKRKQLQPAAAGGVTPARAKSALR